MRRIFISYRRADSAEPAGRIFDRLVREFPRNSVFKDVDSIPAGADFRKVIEHAIKQSDLVIAILGPAWLTVTDDTGRRRIDDECDLMRLELENALRFGKILIPVLVSAGRMPRSSELPATLSELAFRHALPVRPDPDFHRDMDRLIRAIKDAGRDHKTPVLQINKI